MSKGGPQEEEKKIPSFASLIAIVRSRFDEMTDALYAIVATILILEIHIPDLHNVESSAELWSALVTLLPKFIAWVVSFVTVLGIWAENHRFFKTITSLPHEVFISGGGMLMMLTMVPFATGLMGDYYRNSLAVASFGIVMMLYKLFFTFLHMTVANNKDIIVPGFRVEIYKDAIPKVFVLGPVFYFLSALSAFIHPFLAMVLYYIGAGMIPFVYWYLHFKKYTFPDEPFPERFASRQARREAHQQKRHGKWGRNNSEDEE